MKIADLQLGVQEFLEGCPKAGDGVNRWIFSAAMLLHRAGVPEKEMPALLLQATRGCGRAMKPQEIERAVVNSGRVLRDGSEAKRCRTPKWPSKDDEQIKAVVQTGPGMAALREMSPIKWADNKPHVEEVIDKLFPGDPLLCVGESQCRFNTVPRRLWRTRLASQQFIVPSPMTKRVGKTKDGRESKHTLDNTGPRRFLVVEFDPLKWDQLSEAERAQCGSEGAYYDVRRDEHAALLWHLAKHEPFVMAVHSGSKSLHGWFFVADKPESEVKRFFSTAVSLGADPQLWIRSQFVRLPDGRRDNGRRQEVVYFNPQVLEKL